MSKIDYDVTKIKAFVFDVDGVLSASTLQIGEDGQPIRTTNLKDGYSIRKALRQGYRMAIITGGKTEPVKLRYNLLGIKDVMLDVGGKLPVFEAWMLDNGLLPEEVAYMGDDIPDLACMRRAGLSAAPYDAATEAKAEATFVSKFTGGYGCVRDLIEQVLRGSGKWSAEAGDVPANRGY